MLWPRFALAPLLLLVLLPDSGAHAAERAGLRGVVLVTVDTLRADHVAAYGGPVATPAFDALAADGVLVENAYTPTPSTGPAHASLFTGLHPWRHGVLDNAVALPSDLPTLAERLHEHGFQTAAFVSSFILDARFGLARGFDTYAFEPAERYRWRGALRPRFWTRAESTTDSALTWLAGRAGDDARFFVFVHFFDPHTPYAPPEGYALGPDHEVDLEGKGLPAGVPDRSALRDLIRAYRGEVRYVDAQLQRLVSGLAELDLLDHTLVLVTADHGEGLGDRGLLEHGANLHEELVRVPLILRGPGLPAGRRLEGPAQLEDVMPTLLSLTGAPGDGGDGVDLASWLRGEHDDSPRAAVLGRRKPYRGQPELYYERRGAQKWIGRLDASGRIFDLESDPGERRAARGEGATPELRAGVRAARRAASQEVDPEVQRALEALGYAE